MAIRDITNLLQRLEIIAPEANEDVLSFTEDLSDTLRDHERLAAAYTELDNNWRQRYRNRFYNAESTGLESSGGDETSATPDTPASPKTYESLFSNT